MHPQRGHRRHRGDYRRGERRGGPGGRHRVRRGDVRSAILALLDDRTMHGYEMIQELDERTGGRWTPSAGSIYPTLQLLEDEGLVSSEQLEGKRVYSLTEAGRERVPERTEETRPWEQMDPDSPRFAIRKELLRVMDAAKQIARADDEAQMTAGAGILKEARRRLYGLLAEE